MDRLLPNLILIEEFASKAGLTKHQAYDMARKMPPGVIIKLGRRVRLDADRLIAWLASGGTLAEAAPKASLNSRTEPPARAKPIEIAIPTEEEVAKYYSQEDNSKEILENG